MKHKGKATQAALKLMVWSLAALLCVVLIGIASVLVGKFLTGFARFLFGLWCLFSLFCFVLAGSYVEKVGNRERIRRPLALAFHPVGSNHN